MALDAKNGSINEELIRPVLASDAADIAKIYNYYIENTIITFEEEPVSAHDMEDRFSQVEALDLPWLVAQRGDSVVGYAYASKWAGRCAYRHTVEVTIYLANDCVGNGLGSRLYEALFCELGKTSMHVAIGGVSLPNAASVALHEKFGMKKTAHFEEVGYKFGGWLDVGYWQLNLEPWKLRGTG